ncbi:MAG: hypothetical protein M1826_004265 [Phylliscum demangeonii]|nr:MAG: hypothetical protein M1826_004265 [Phylliscum demangeonii]
MVNLPLARLRSQGSSKNSPGRSPSRTASPAQSPEEPKGAPTQLILRVTIIRVSGPEEAEDVSARCMSADVLSGQARALAAKDRSGTSDPYLVLMLGDARSVTHAVTKTLHPEWNVTCDLPIVGEQSLLLECVCWDKDRFRKEYMGEFEVAIDELFVDGKVTVEPCWFALKCKRKTTHISGEVELQFALLDPSNAAARPEQIFAKFQVMAAVSTSAEDESDELAQLENADGEGDGEGDDDVEDVEGTSDVPDDPSKPESVEKKKRRLRLARLKRKRKARAYNFQGGSDVVGILFVEILRITDLPPERNMTRTSFDMDPFVVASLGKKTYRTRVIRHNLNPVYDEKMIFQVLPHEQTYHVSFSIVDRDKLSGNDFVGTANLTLADVIAAAPEADLETGLYHLREPADATTPTLPSTRSRFKLPLSRSSSSTSINKLASKPGLPTRKSSSSLRAANAAAADSRPAPGGNGNGNGNGGNGSSSQYLSPVETDNDSNVEEDFDMKPYTLPIALKHKERWEFRHNPQLFIRAKYVPYPAVRQQFWRALLKQYDADDSGRISKVELSTMLDTLGSTLKDSTIDSFYERFAKDNKGQDPANFELTFDQAVICLEDQLQKTSRKRPAADASSPQAVDHGPGPGPGELPGSPTTPSPEAAKSMPLSDSTLLVDHLGSSGEEGNLLVGDDLADEKGEEHVVEIQECPICHQPRLNKKSDADIITHIATCALQDWKQVNSLVMGGFVTPSQAQRKWYSKIITKISYGGYKLGANSANILVQDRITGQINEERMSVYVRLGIRLLYKGLKSREMEAKRIRKLLRSLSIKQGKKYDDPASVRVIPNFISFHRLNMAEVLLPVEEFRTFNEFFYRKLKADARPCSAPDNPRIIVSPADCRSVLFNRVEEATAVWIKGREFSVARLLGNAYPDDAKRYVHGALGVFRLAPQDYHRFHIPVDGVMDRPKLIAGEYYTVNPMAIRSALDVYGENVRVIVPIDSVAHGRVMVVCVGAMMVGSTVITSKAGQPVKRADELGYFKFGGSTIILLFEPGTMKFDDDLVGNSKAALETLIRAGTSIGSSIGQKPYRGDMQKRDVTDEDRKEADRRIQGSLADNASGEGA